MTGPDSIIDLAEADTRFIRRLESELGASDLNKCFQCGVCTASCPVREVEASFSPRKIMKLAKLGLRKHVYASDTIWLCSMCFMCQERCPQDVRPPEVMTVLRNMAAKDGVAQPNLLKLLDILKTNGRIYTVDEFTNEERGYRDLPEVDPTPEFIKHITEAKP
jgi:heterodisulfide reductase subunit C